MRPADPTVKDLVAGLSSRCASTHARVNRFAAATAAAPAALMEMFFMPRISAGLLMYHFRDGKLQVLLAHPGGPLFQNKDEGDWSIPKGEVEPGEDLLEAAKREFREETGVAPTGPFIALKPVKQKGGKIVHAWGFRGTCDPSAIISNTFTMEWPPRSGRQMEFPEIDRADFFDVAVAKRKIKAAQVALIEQLQESVSGGTAHRSDSQSET